MNVYYDALAITKFLEVYQLYLLDLIEIPFLIVPTFIVVDYKFQGILLTMIGGDLTCT
jgi:hypothetical protein